MTDLAKLMSIAANDDRDEESSETAADLARAQAAYDKRRRRRATLATGAASLCAVTAIGVTVLVAQDHPANDVANQATHGSPQSGESRHLRLISDEVDAGPYTFGQVPDGWDLQANGPFAVVFTPPTGGVSGNADVFVGKLVVMYDKNPLGADTAESNGRTYSVSSDSGYTTLSTETLAGQPDGVVRVQYPDSAGWSQDSVLDFLFSVTVNDGAKAGRG